jgi:methyltransferase (TIGR00027 family)
MIAGRASLTAALVALARGERPPAQLLPEPLGSGVRLFELTGPFKAALSPLARAGSLGFVDHIELRTAAIDAAVTAAAHAGIEQVVLLGAGLDARAWCMPALAGATVFEIDHPTTQVAKRAWLGASTPLARAVRFVPVDFERELFPPALAAAGFDRHARTMWIWEGVVMYLSRAAILATLGDLSRLSATGSILAVTYIHSDMGLLPPVRAMARSLLALLGEPLATVLSPVELRALLSEQGFSLRDDTGSSDWARDVGRSARRALLFAGERLAIATRRQDGS